MVLARVVAASLLLLLMTSVTFAAQLSTSTVETPRGQAVYVVVQDDIEIGDSGRFFRLLRQNPAVSGVMLHSLGGSADDGLAIAKYVFEHKLDTMVTSACHSICAIMFLAGNQKFLAVDAAITFHTAYKQIGDWVVVDHPANGTIAWFLGHMGYPLPLARLWVSTPTDEATPITLEMNDDLGLGFTIIPSESEF